MKISASITDYTWPGGTAALGGELERVARAADAAGLDTLWLADHVMQAAPWADAGDPMLESCTALGWIAARTERIRLGTMVAAITYRPASVLIKAVTTLDVLSGGRAWLGVGAGYHEEEASRFDLPLPPVAERFAELESALSTRLEPDEAPAAFAARCAALRDLGLDHVVVITPGGWTPKGIGTIAAGLEV